MKQHVTLKGRKEGYELILDDASSFSEIKEDLSQLLDNLKKDVLKEKITDQISLEITTGRRLLSEEMLTEIDVLLQDYQQFTLKNISAEVVTRINATIWKEKDSVQLCTTRVRSGQVIVYPGDVLVLSAIQPGGTVKAVGNIYVLGELRGTVHAGCEGNDEAIVVADLTKASQIRIGEIVEIMQKKDDEATVVSAGNQIAYINDLHVMQFKELDDLKEIKFGLHKEIGGI